MRCAYEYLRIYLSILQYSTFAPRLTTLAKAKLGMFWRLKYDYQRVYEYGMDEVALGKVWRSYGRTGRMGPLNVHRDIAIYGRVRGGFIMGGDDEMRMAGW